MGIEGHDGRIDLATVIIVHNRKLIYAHQPHNVRQHVPFISPKHFGHDAGFQCKQPAIAAAKAT